MLVKIATKLCIKSHFLLSHISSLKVIHLQHSARICRRHLVDRRRVHRLQRSDLLAHRPAKGRSAVGGADRRGRHCRSGGRHLARRRELEMGVGAAAHRLGRGSHLRVTLDFKALEIVNAPLAEGNAEQVFVR